jgi:hypothetical protein
MRCRLWTAVRSCNQLSRHGFPYRIINWEWWRYRKISPLQYKSRLGGVTVSVLVIGPEVHGFKVGRGIIRAIKVRSTPSFGGEVKRGGGRCRKFFRHIKDLYEYERNIS